MIRIKNIYKVFENKNKRKITIFSNFNLSIEEKEIVGLFGSNGTGKSTILNIISGSDKNYQGNVEVSSKNISYIYQKPQDILLPWFTSRENILLACDYKNISREDGEKKIDSISEDLKIDFSLYSYPFELSGGQQQIVAIMRALITKPDILLMDEPFAALDIEKRINILNLLKKEKKRMTVIITSHRGDEIAEILDRAIVFQNQPVEIMQDIYSDKEINFEKQVKEIRFNKNEN